MDVGVVGMVLEPGQPRLLQVDVVVVGQVVDADNLVSAFKQLGGDVRTDEAGGAGY